MSSPDEFKAHDGPVRTILVSHDGKLLFSGSNDGYLKVWDLCANCQSIGCFNIACGWILSLLQADANHLFVGGKNGVVYILQSDDDRSDLKKIGTLCCGSHGIVSIQLAPSKEFIVVTDEVGKIYVWKNPLFFHNNNG
jgi:WD40 repeat protein